MFLPDIDTNKIRIFLRVGPTDLRKAINGLSVIAQEKLEEDIFSGNLFIFCNRRKNIMKALYWQRNGFCLWLKRLEQDRFKWPQTEQECLEIDDEDLKRLLRGFDIVSSHKTLNYSQVL